jgi:uncharacterized protein YukE
MSDRVLSTGEARQAIVKMQQVINGPLVEQIDTLNRQGQTLSDPNVWDGRLAQEFRSHWPEVYSSLQKAKEQLEELRSSVQKINENIMGAGGNR